MVPQLLNFSFAKAGKAVPSSPLLTKNSLEPPTFCEIGSLRGLVLQGLPPSQMRSQGEGAIGNKMGGFLRTLVQRLGGTEGHHQPCSCSLKPPRVISAVKLFVPFPLSLALTLSLYSNFLEAKLVHYLPQHRPPNTYYTVFRKPEPETKDLKISASKEHPV